MWQLREVLCAHLYSVVTLFVIKISPKVTPYPPGTRRIYLKGCHLKLMLWFIYSFIFLQRNGHAVIHV